MSQIKNLIDSSWEKVIIPFFESKEGLEILNFLKEESKQGKIIYPKNKDCFNAFKYTKYTDLKVCIVGLDPYIKEIKGEPEACGLSFSYIPKSKTDLHTPRSLKIILKEVEDDAYNGLRLPQFYDEKDERDLSRWAEQGVLMLNTALTVEKGITKSHWKQWQPFTKYLLEYLSLNNSGIIYVLWGKDAQSYKQYINEKTNFILEAPHPAAELYSGGNGGFYGCKHFSKINEIIKQNNGEVYKILW